MKLSQLIMAIILVSHYCVMQASEPKKTQTESDKKREQQFSPEQRKAANDKLLKILLSADRACSIKTEKENKPIDQKSIISQIEQALTEGANVNARFIADLTPLILASQARLEDVTKLLIRHGAKVGREWPQNTPLFHAIFQLNQKTDRYEPQLPATKTVSFIEILLNDANTNSVNNLDPEKRTILSFVVSYDELAEITKLLLERGAKFDIRERLGEKTALDYATPKNKKIIEDFIRLQQEIRQAAKTRSKEHTIIAPVESGEPIMIPGQSTYRDIIAGYLVGDEPGEVSRAAGSGSFVEPE